jgi:hypothetical protein
MLQRRHLIAGAWYPEYARLQELPGVTNRQRVQLTRA